MVARNVRELVEQLPAPRRRRAEQVWLVVRVNDPELGVYFKVAGSERGNWYYVTDHGCTCQGFCQHGYCRHSDRTMIFQVVNEPEVANACDVCRARITSGTTLCTACKNSVEDPSLTLEQAEAELFDAAS